MAEEMNKKLEDILAGMGLPEAAAPAATAAPATEPAPTQAGASVPVPAFTPQYVQAGPSPELMGLVQRLEARLGDTEKKLAEAQERAVAATVRLQEKEAAQKEMETMFQSLRNQQRAEETHQMEREMAAKMSGRIQALEERLDKQLSEMQAAWTASVREIVNTVKNQPQPTFPVEFRQSIDLEAAKLRQSLEGEAAKTREALGAIRHDLDVRSTQNIEVERRLAQVEARDTDLRAQFTTETDRGSKAEHLLAGELAQLKSGLTALQSAMPQLVEAEQALEKRQHTLAEWGVRAGGEIADIKIAQEKLFPLPQQFADFKETATEHQELAESREAAATQRLGELETLAAGLQHDQKQIVDYADGVALSLQQTASALDALGRRLDQEVSRLQSESVHRDETLDTKLREVADSLNGTQRMLEAWQESMERRLATVQAGWSGVLGTVNDFMGKLKRENEAQMLPWRSRADELERKIAALETAWPVMSQAIPESVLRKVRQDLFKIETRISELEHRK